jgi:hypothetical protein
MIRATRLANFISFGIVCSATQRLRSGDCVGNCACS